MSLSNKKKKAGFEDQPPQQQKLDDLSKLKVPELKSRLKKKGLPVGGRKNDLIERLRKYPNGYQKPKAWQYSNARKKLKRDLLSPTSSIHNMGVGDIWKSDTQYQQYPNFPKYYKDLKKQVEAEKKQAHLDDVKAERHIRNNPQSHLNKRGYPHWHNHPAKEFLEVDVANKLHERMSRSKLRETRSAYMAFPADVFTKRVNREAEKQKAVQFWAYKRNKRGMKKYLQDVAERANA